MVSGTISYTILSGIFTMTQITQNQVQDNTYKISKNTVKPRYSANLGELSKLVL